VAAAVTGPVTDGPIDGPGQPGAGLVARIVVERDGFTVDVDLSVEPGTTLALLGPNGAGKSTIVEALSGLLPIDRGRIVLAGTVLDDPAAGCFVAPERRGVGVVFQDYLLFDHLTVADNVAFPLRHRTDPGGGRSTGRAGRSWHRGRASREAVAPLLRALELTDLAGERPARLSGGQAQRVALARALAGDPGLLLLDEPLAAVDVSTRARLRRLLIERLDHYPGPRLLITHDPAEAFALATRLAVIEGGRLVQEGSPAEVRRHPATPWVATMAGTNLLAGTARAALVTVDDSGFVLTTTTALEGAVRAVIDPRAVSLHRERPEGSPRNTWRSTVDWVEPLGRTARVRLADPLPLTVDITPTSAQALDLGPGREVWAAVKATEITVQPR
jgi:molybdate transport system ATP-binding protein